LHRRDVQVLLALVLAATALRPQLVGVGPLLPRISDDLGMRHWQAGLLGTIPVLCMGVFALPAGKVASWVGTKRAVGACVLVIGVFGLARAASDSALVLIALTIPVGIGMGLVGALVPVAAKERFSTRPALATGAYTTGIQIGATAATLAAVPLAIGASWELPLAVFSAAALAGALWWLVLGPDAAPPVTPDASHSLRAAARRGEVWNIVAMFALMSVIYYGFVAWLPGAYVEHGWGEGSAAAVMAVLTAAQIPGGMIVAALADEHRRPFVIGFALVALAGTAGLAGVPGGAWLWSALVGLSIGALFPLVLTLPLDLEDHPAGVAAVIGVVLGVGYSVAALAPTVLGALRDLSGTFAGALWSLVGVAVLLLAFSHRVMSRLPAQAAPARI
jgi:CP family cyanate transporter-like MFS transporter